MGNALAHKKFFYKLNNRGTKEISRALKIWVKPGSNLIIDQWRTYYKSVVECQMNSHSTVNHIVEFVTDEGIHTQNIEILWGKFKSFFKGTVL